MVNNKSFKSTDLLRIENEELRSRLAIAEESIRSLQSEKANTNLATGKKNEQAGPKLTRNDNNISIASLYSSMTDGVATYEVIIDVTGKAIDYLITGVNPAFENITGLKKRKIIGKKATEVYSVTKAPYIDIYSKVAFTGKPETFETFFPAMEKHFHISVFSTGKGKFATAFQDITERKRSEELTFRQNSILEAIKLILEATLTLGTERELGSACLEIAQKLTQSKFGFIAEIREKGLQDLSISNPGWEACNIVDEKGHKMSGSIFKKHGLYGRVISEGKSLIANDPLNHPDSIGLPAGHPSLESFLGVPLIKGGQTIGIIALGNRPGGYSQTEQNTLEAIAPAVVEAFIRKRTDDALRASEERLRIALDAARLGTWDFDLKSGKVNNSLRHDQIFGYNEPQQGWTFDMVCSHLLPEYEPIFRKAFGEAKKTGVFDFEGKVAWPDSTIHWIATHGVVHFNSEGRPDHVIGVIADITERKRSEEDLKRSEQLYHAIGESIDYGIWVCDNDGKNTYASESYLKLVGLTQEQCSEFGWGDTLHPDDAEKTIAAWKECSETGGVWDIEHRFRGVDGKWHPILARGIPIRDENGNITMWAGINLDISKIKQTEDSLRESEERLRVTLSSIGDAVLSVDKTGRISFLNPAAVKLMGWEPEEALGRQVKDVFRIINEKTLLPAEDIVQKVLLEGKVFELSNHTALITKDGRQIPIEDSAAPIKDQKGNVLGVILVFHDVSQKRRSAEALHSSLVKYKTLFDCLPLGITVSDENGQILESNQLSQVLLGLTKEEQEKRKINGQEWQLLTPDGTPMSPGDYASVRALKENHIVENVEMGVVRPDNTIAWINVTAAPIDLDGYGLLIIYSDITGRKLMEESLKESEERFRNLVKNAPTAIYELDFRTRKLTSVNDAMYELSGYSTEELLAIDSLELLTPESKELFISRINDSFRSIKPSENVEYKVRAKDGRIIDAVLNMRFNFNEQGIPVGALVVGHDITERKQAAEELRKTGETLRETESKLRSVLNATQESIYMFDRDGIIIMSNDIGIERMKKTEYEIIGHNFSEFTPPGIAKKMQLILEKVIASGMPVEYEDERKGSTYHHYFYPVINENIVSFVASYGMDITERKKAEQKLKESEDRFRTISESIQVMIAIVRIKDSILTFVNEHYEKNFGFKTGELKNKKVNNLFYYPDDKKSISAILRAKGHFENEELKVTRSDGSAFWIMTSVRKINFMNEPSYVSASIDITETKNVQEELFHLNRTLNARSKSSQAMMYSDNEAKYLATVCKIIIEDCGHKMVWIGYAQNDKAKSVKPVAQYGFDQGYIDQLNISWDDTERGNGPTGRAIRTGKTSLCRNMLTDPAFKPWRDAAKERGFASSVVLPLISDGKPFGAISIYSKEHDPFSENEISLLFDLANDLAYGISYLRLQESERAAVKVIRENETKLKDLIATKDKFFNIVAHDLKNPFTSLLGSSELLFENIEQLNKDNIKELAMILNDSAKGGHSILLNLLDWSRSQTGQLKVCPQKINLKDLIEENITNLQLPAANKEISLMYELPEDLHIIADKNMVSTILRNLLSNGLKFTPKKGTVVVKTKIEPDNIVIFVKDNGVGISPERIEKLFNLESRNSMPGTENEQGTGLGLKLSKEFAEKHGGNIFVESEKGKGSTFCLTLPVKIENNSLAN